MSSKRKFERKHTPPSPLYRPSPRPAAKVDASPTPAPAGFFTRAKGYLLAAVYAAGAVILLIRGNPKRALALFALAIAYGAMARDRGVK